MTVLVPALGGALMVIGLIGMFVGPLPTTFTVTPLLTTIVVA